MKLGLDIGSTTIKCILLDDEEEIIFKTYRRHYSKIVEESVKLLEEIAKNYLIDNHVKLMISGSGAMGLANQNGLDFMQEVFATKQAVERYYPDCDCVIELGGEDAKILFLGRQLEVRMNGTCAGGTGAFIDQMANLLNCDTASINELANNAKQHYTIASRCGVFAKSDIQPLLNQGAKKEDVALSIYYAIVNQTIAGLAQGRKISGKVLYLGGPLTYMSELRKCFDTVLKVDGKCPDNSLYYVSLGCAFSANQEVDVKEVIAKLKDYGKNCAFNYMEPLFKTQEEYEEFVARHQKTVVEQEDITCYNKEAYLGVDAGSTTLKSVLISSEGKLLWSNYQKNNGELITLVRDMLKMLYQEYPDIKIVGACATGYGEELVKNAFRFDEGIVETVAHLTGAKSFKEDVDFIIDIGGQDMKCFMVKDGVIDNIFLNEACSSGCGSFLQTFASSLGYDIESFAKLGLFAKKPVDLGSRCTVFMNSSVKQAQKDGATIEDISAGLAVSVVKNALYKVIRLNKEALGKNIIVQGGTFYNDALLRAFEKELGCFVIRPNIAGLMGAYGAALFVKNRGYHKSSLLSLDELLNFDYSVSSVKCGGCENHCQLTINRFNERKFISGNKCDRVNNKKSDNSLNIYEYKRNLLKGYKDVEGPRGIVVGLPMGLNMFELLPFWYTFFTKLGFGVKSTMFSDNSTYSLGQNTIPSDTVCFPAKLVHGHVEKLIVDGVDAIFYPCMSYNVDEKVAKNKYNCPVVAYYPEVIGANISSLKNIIYINDYVSLNKPLVFVKKMTDILKKYFTGISQHDVYHAAIGAYHEYHNYMQNIYGETKRIIDKANEDNKEIIVLAGRPYHIDPLINHGIDHMICSYGCALVSEDGVAHLNKNHPDVHVLNQWTYHARLYDSCEYVLDKPNMDFVQLVSFGCGCDAITQDECRRILKENNKIYTQLKIDEINNLGACKIRIRSLLAALKEERL